MVNSERLSSMGNYSAAEENSVNEDSFEDDFTQKLLKNNELKDDK